MAKACLQQSKAHVSSRCMHAVYHTITWSALMASSRASVALASALVRARAGLVVLCFCFCFDLAAEAEAVTACTCMGGIGGV